MKKGRTREWRIRPFLIQVENKHLISTDRQGFEPWRAIHPTRFPIVLLKPLGHLSQFAKRRGWDSNPRGTFGPDGLANRCRNHLATPPKLLIAPPGIEPGLFCSRGRRVASYTKGQFYLQYRLERTWERAKTLNFKSLAGPISKRATGLEPVTFCLGSRRSTN